MDAAGTQRPQLAKISRNRSDTTLVEHFFVVRRRRLRRLRRLGEKVIIALDLGIDWDFR
jgi:hypothetical protein